MQEETQALNVIYQARRQARGPEQPPPRRRWRFRLFLGAGLVLGAALVAGALYLRWSLTRASTVQASVRAAVVDLAPAVDAPLKDLLVHVGQRVRARQELARLDDSQALVELAVAEADRAITASRCAQARTRLKLARIRVETQIELARRRVDIARAGLAAAAAELALHKARLPAEVEGAQAERDAARAALKLLEEGVRQQEIEAARLRLENEKALEKLYATELTHTERLYKKQFDSLYNLEATRTKVETQRNKVREAELELDLLEAGARPPEIERAASTLAGREADLALARTGDRRTALMDTTLATRQAELRQAQAELKHAEAMALEVTLAEEQSRAAEAELRKAEAEVEGRRATLKGLCVVSPVSGTVIRTFRRPGELCRKGEPILRVADDSAGRWVEGFVRERDAHRIRVGQAARVELTGSGAVVDAQVEAVGLSTSSLARPGEPAASEIPMAGASKLVWVKLRPNGTMDASLPGMSARAVILLR